MLTLSSKAGFLILDVDSTVLNLESADQFVDFCCTASANRDELVAEFEAITKMGMNGEIGFRESFARRTELIDATTDQIAEFSDQLDACISTSFLENIEFIRSNRERIFVVSGGVQELISPSLVRFGIDPTHIYANRYTYKDGKVDGFDSANPMSETGGKIKVLEHLVGAGELSGNIDVVGDGWTDLETVLRGPAHRFFAFMENLSDEDRRKVLEEVFRNSDRMKVIRSFGEYIASLEEL